MRALTFITICLSFHEGEGGSGNYVASGYSVYEEENEHLQEGLRAKVSALKSVSDHATTNGMLVVLIGQCG